MIAELLTNNNPTKPQIVTILQDLLYRQNLASKKQGLQFTQSNINKSFINYTLKYYDSIGGQGVFSSNLSNYELLAIDPSKETFLELTLKVKVGLGVPPPTFRTQVWLVVFDGVNVLQTQEISTLAVPNTILSFTTNSNFELVNKINNLYFGLFIDTNLTTTQKTYIDNNISLDWSIVINQNEII